MGCGSSQEIEKIAPEPAANSPEPAANSPEPAANPQKPAANSPRPAVNSPERAANSPGRAANPQTPVRTTKHPASYFPPHGGEITGKIMSHQIYDAPGIAANVPPMNRDFGGTVVPVKMRKNPQTGVTIVDSPEGQTAYFEEIRTVFLDKCFAGGCYMWTVKIDYVPNGVNTFFIGVCPSSSVEDAEKTLLSWTGDCPCLGVGSLSPDGTHTFACPYSVPGEYPCDESVAVPDGSYVTIALYNSWQVLWYWVNGKQVPHIIKGWNLPVHVGVTCFPGTSFTSIALRKMYLPLECNVYTHWLKPHPKDDSRLTIIPVSATLRPDSLDASVVKLQKTPEGETCVFTGAKTVFLDVKITEGVFSWKIRVNFNEKKKSTFYIGTALPDALAKFKPINVSIGKIPGSCSFSFGGMHDGGGHKYIFAPYCGSEVPLNIDSDVVLDAGRDVTVEINADKHTLMFFIQDGQVPHLIENVPTPLYLGVTGDDGTSITALAFSRLAEPSNVVLSTKVWTYKA